MGKVLVGDIDIGNRLLFFLTGGIPFKPILSLETWLFPTSTSLNWLDSGFSFDFYFLWPSVFSIRPLSNILFNRISIWYFQEGLCESQLSPWMACAMKARFLNGDVKTIYYSYHSWNCMHMQNPCQSTSSCITFYQLNQFTTFHMYAKWINAHASLI